MFYGLQFNTSAGESMQVVINSSNLQVYARATSGGVFGEWEPICGPSGGGGALEAEKAAVAEKAYRLASPMAITFTGDVQGSVSFDGSRNVNAALSLRNGSADVTDVIDEAVAALIRDNTSALNSVLVDWVRTMIDNAIDYHVRKSGWHISQDRGNN